MGLSSTGYIALTDSACRIVALQCLVFDPFVVLVCGLFMDIFYIMKTKFNQRQSSIPQISANRIITSHLHSLNTIRQHYLPKATTLISSVIRRRLFVFQ
jgi:hypothetical protein